jgi:nucleoside 2-deoxyribosyltransferase
MEHPTIYLAGPLFTLAERTHNLNLEKALRACGYEVILPQRRALEFMTPQGLDLKQMAADCAAQASNQNNILVANIDGPDADSGTAIEYALAIGAVGRAILYRTDFRTAPEKEVGVNAMFGLTNTAFIHMPCFISTEDEAREFYLQLAFKIDRAIFHYFSQGNFESL